MPTIFINMKKLLELTGTILTILSVYLYAESIVNIAAIVGIAGNIAWIFWGKGIVTGYFYILQFSMLFINMRAII